MKRAFSQLLLVVIVLAFVTGCATMQSRWNAVKSTDTIQAYEKFLRDYPRGDLSDQARIRLNQLYEQRDWRYASSRNTIQSYEDFLKRYPRSSFSDGARSRLEALYLQKAKDLNTITAYEDFLRRYPESKFAGDIRNKIEELKIKTKEATESQKQKVGNVCSICGAPAVFWCPVRKAWFCDTHAGKTYTPGGGYRYRCR